MVYHQARDDEIKLKVGKMDSIDKRFLDFIRSKKNNIVLDDMKDDFKTMALVRKWQIICYLITMLF